MDRPIGIDLGTTYSATAFVDERGEAHIVTGDDGHAFVPSVVLFEDDEVTVGQYAKDEAIADADRVVTCVKRHMGDPDWRFEVQGASFSAVDVSAQILRHLKSMAEASLRSTVTQAVVTVPAYFLDAERTATMEAARLAGLEVLGILNEPTAAAIHYGVEEDQSDQTLLVYDLGGGTFDVTIMRSRAGRKLEILTTRGNHRLGGTDWDECICDHVAGLFRDEHGLDPRDDATAKQDLLQRAERAKITLSERQKTRVVCHYAGKSTTVPLTRDKLEELSAHLAQVTDSEVGLALKDAGLTSGDIDLVLLVGGSVKMPMIQSLMRPRGKAMRMSREADHCVALGAALEAARKVMVAGSGGGLYKGPAAGRLQSIEVHDRIPHSLGLLTVEDGRLRNTIIIPKDSELSCERSREDLTTNRDGQDRVTVHLVQGESSDPEACVPVASFDFVGIPARAAGEGPIRVVYRHNQNGVVDVSAVDICSGESLAQEKRPLEEISVSPTVVPRSVALVIDTSGSMAGAELEEAKGACQKFIDETDFGSVRAGLVAFGSRARVVTHLCSSADELKASVASLSTSGSTAMAEAITTATDELMTDEDSAQRFLVLFTDGEPDSEERARRAASRAKKAEIEIICIGVSNANMALLEELATSSENRFFADDGQQLMDTFGNIARLISGKRI